MRIEIASFADVDRLRAFLTREEREQSSTKVQENMRIRHELARGLRREMLGEALGVRAEDLSFLEDGQTKPRLREAAGWDFNISHAGEYVICAVARGPVGVDIELIRPVREMESIIGRYFHADERAAWLALEPSLREEAFFVLWCAREAAMKCTGRGLAAGLSVTRVDPAILRCSEAAARVADADLVLQRLAAPRGYVALVAQTAAA
jgi:4'-phosphopantetheinyl transferase